MQRDPKIARALEDYRRFQCLTQAKMAELLGTTQGHYSEVIGGQRELSKGAMQRAVELGIPANVLLGAAEPAYTMAQIYDAFWRSGGPDGAWIKFATQLQKRGPPAGLASAPAAEKKADSDARLIDLLAACRDAFPIPDAGHPLEPQWMEAMQSPSNVPAYVQACLSHPQAQRAASETRHEVYQRLGQQGGEWLGASRTWMQSNVRDGDRLTWGSGEVVSVPFYKLEELARTAAAAALAARSQGGA